MNYKKTVYSRCVRTRRPSEIRVESRQTERRTPCEVEPCVSYCVSDGYPSLATVYPPRQCWRDINDGCEGFERGTIFSELDKPFMGDKCKNGGKCR